MEKLSSLTPEGAPAGKGENVFNPSVESAKEATISSLTPQPPERSEGGLWRSGSAQDVKGEESMGTENFFMFVPFLVSVWGVCERRLSCA